MGKPISDAKKRLWKKKLRKTSDKSTDEDGGNGINKKKRRASRRRNRYSKMLHYQKIDIIPTNVGTFHKQLKRTLKEPNGVCSDVGVPSNMVFAKKAVRRMHMAHTIHLGNCIKESGEQSRNKRRKETFGRDLINAAKKFKNEGVTWNFTGKNQISSSGQD